MGLSLQIIRGLMFGVEYHEEDDAFYVVLDVGFLRFLLIKGTSVED